MSLLFLKAIFLHESRLTLASDDRDVPIIKNNGNKCFMAISEIRCKNRDKISNFAKIKVLK